MRTQLRLRDVALLVCLLTMFAVNNITAQTATITPTNGIVCVTVSGTGTGTGSSWADAAKLTDALEAAGDANSGITEIQVASGIYALSSRDDSFVVPPGITLRGGYTSSGGFDNLNPTILDGGNHAHHVVIAINKTSTPTIIEKFTIQNGLADGTGSKEMDGVQIARNSGAGVYVHTEGSGQVILRNNIIQENEAKSTANSAKKAINVNELSEKIKDKIDSGDRMIEIISSVIGSVVGELVETLLAEIPVVNVLVGQLADFIASEISTLILDACCAEAFDDLGDNFIDLYYYMPVAQAQGGGVYAFGNLELQNNEIKANKVTTTSTVDSDPSSDRDPLGISMWIAIPVASSSGAGVYADGTITMKGNTISGNNLKSYAVANTDAGIFGSGSGFLSKAKHISLPLSITSGSGVSLSGKVIAEGNEITHNEQNANTKSAKTKLEKFDKLDYQNSGASINMGGGASLAGEVIFKNNTVDHNVSKSDSENDMLGIGFAYGGGVYAGLSGREGATNSFLLENNSMSYNTLSATDYWNSSMRGGGLVVSAPGTKVEVINNTASNNKITSKTDASGGGVYLEGNSSVRGNTVSNNTINIKAFYDPRFLDDMDFNVKDLGNFMSVLADIFRLTHNDEKRTFCVATTGGGLYSVGELLLEDNTIEGQSVDLSCEFEGTPHNIVTNTDVGNTLLGLGVYAQAREGSQDVIEIRGNHIRDNKSTMYSKAINGDNNKVEGYALGGGIYLYSDNEYLVHEVDGNEIRNNSFNYKGYSNAHSNASTDVNIFGGGLYSTANSRILNNHIEANSIKIDLASDNSNNNKPKGLASGGGIAVSDNAETFIWQNRVIGNSLSVDADSDDDGANGSKAQAISHGGGIYVRDMERKIQIQDNLVQKNTIYSYVQDDDEKDDTDAESYGGGLYVYANKKEVLLDGNYIFENKATAKTANNDNHAYAKSFGGGLYVSVPEGGLFEANRLTIQGNKTESICRDGDNDSRAYAYSRGGGAYFTYYNRNDLGAVYNSLISGNDSYAYVTHETTGGGTHDAKSRGGGIFLYKGKTEFINLTVANNTLRSHPNEPNDKFALPDYNGYKEGAGVYCEEATLDVKNSILISNYLDKSNENKSNTSSDIEADKDSDKEYKGHSKVNVAYSLLNKKRASKPIKLTDCITIDQSDPVPTTDYFRSSTNYHLKKGSEAIDAGHNGELPTNYNSLDLDGKYRQMGNFIDMGAYETQIEIEPDQYGILYVKKGGRGNMCGNSWENALAEVAHALAAAHEDNDVKQIWVAEGTYFPEDVLNVMEFTSEYYVFNLRSNLKLYGGFSERANSTDNGAGNGTDAAIERALATRNWGEYETILSGNNPEQAKPSYHVVYGNGIGNLVLDGFIVSGGEANNSAESHGCGGGIRLSESGTSSVPITFRHLQIKENKAVQGGGLAVLGSRVDILNSSISHNRSEDTGGGIAILPSAFGSTLKIVNTTVVDNQAGAAGAACFSGNSGDDVTWLNSTVANNVGLNGDEVVSDMTKLGSNYTFMNSIVWGNQPARITVPIANLSYSNIEGMEFGSSSSNRSKDPRFADPATGNYTLLTLSPSRNAGSNDLYSTNSYGSVDLAGNDRIDGVIDMGAYENAAIQPDKGGVLYVKKGGAGKRNGSSWANAFWSVYLALEAARQEGSAIREIWVAEGTYYPYSLIEYWMEDNEDGEVQDQSFELLAGIKLYGGFPVDASDQRNAPHSGLSKEQALNTRDWDAYETVLSGELKSEKLGLDANVYHVVTADSDIDSQDPIWLDGFTIRGGKANGSNESDKCGGGIFAQNYSLNLVNLNIQDNIANDYASAIYFTPPTSNYEARLVISNSQIKNNTLVNNIGGAIYTDGHLQLINSQVVANKGPRSTGIYARGKRNYDASYSLEAINSLIEQHQYYGIYTEHNKFKLYNLSIIDNGTGIENTSTTTITGYTPCLYNSIIWDCLETAIKDPDVIDLQNNNIQGLEAQTSENISQEPTFYGDSYQYAYALQPGSPGVDAGSNSLYTNSGLAQDTDLAGNQRIYYTGAYTGTDIDMGAYESMPIITPDDQGIVYVNLEKDGQGSSWADAYPNVHDPLTRSATDKRIKQIWVAKGDYNLKGDDANHSYYLKQGLKLIGDFAGVESSPEERTILPAGSFTRSVTIPNETRLLASISNLIKIEAEAITYDPEEKAVDNTLIDGFTFRDDFNSHNRLQLHQKNAAYKVQNSRFRGLESNIVIYNEENAKLYLDNVAFLNGKAVLMNASSSELHISNSLIDDNSTNAPLLNNNTSSHLYMVNTLITNNNTGAYGIFYNNEDSNYAWVNTTVVNNTMTSTAKLIDDKRQSTSTSRIYNSIIYNNEGDNAIWDLTQSGYNWAITIRNSDIEGLKERSSANGNMDKDPKFKSGSYELENFSFCLDAGDDDLYAEYSDWAFDVMGEKRIRGLAIDMGAVESTFEANPDKNKVLYVDHTRNGDGSSWKSALNHLSDALLEARKRPGDIDEIWVADGVYSPLYSADDDRDNSKLENRSFVLRSNLGVYGGFAGHELTKEERRIDDNRTTLDGADVSYHVLIAPEVKNLMLEGFVVFRGNANSTGSMTVDGVNIPSQDGAGIYIANSNATADSDYFLLQHLLVQSNDALRNGGGIYSVASGICLNNSVLQVNSAGSYGGGIYIRPGSVSLIDRYTFEARNTAFDSNSGSASSNNGGGVAFAGFDNAQQVGFINTTFINPQDLTTSKRRGIVADPATIAGLTGAPQLKIYNSIIHETPIAISFPVPEISYSYLYQLPSGATGTDNIYGLDPRLRGYALRSDSPCIDKGSNSLYGEEALKEDVDVYYSPRLFRHRVDMGAMEYAPDVVPDSQGIVYVDDDKTGTGSSWADAYPNLADPLKLAQSNKDIQQIWVAAGTYYPAYSEADDNVMISGLESYTLVEGVKIYGGFAGTEDDPALRVVGKNTSYLKPDPQGGEIYHLISAINVNPDKEMSLDYTLLDGFTLQNNVSEVLTSSHHIGDVTVTVYNHSGSVIYNLNSAYQLSNIVVENSSAVSSDYSDLIFADNSQIRLLNGIFRNNDSQGSRSDGFNFLINFTNSSELTMVNTLIADNKVLGPILQMNYNGAKSKINMTNVTMTGNRGWSLLQAFDSSDVVLGNSVLWGNKKANGEGKASIVTSLWTNENVSHNFTDFDELLTADPSNRKDTDPLLKSDYTLSEYSPAIDFGSDKYYLPLYFAYDLAGADRIQDGRIDLGPYEAKRTYKDLLWTGEAGDHNWNNPNNWQPKAIPSKEVNVYISGKATTYPFLTANNVNECKDIYFMHGSEVGRPDLLEYERAHIQLNFGLKDPAHSQTTSTDMEEHLPFSANYSATPLSRGAWHMLSIPLQEVVTGDLSFGAFPNSFLRKFSSEGTGYSAFSKGTWTEYFTTNIETLAPAEGFIYQLRDYRDADFYQEYGDATSITGKPYGLRQVNGILELPFFEDEEMSAAHRLHKYEDKLSHFGHYDYNRAGLPMAPNTPQTIYRSPNAYRFVFEKDTATYPNVSYTLNFSDDNFALVGNPYMSTIDFDALYNDNRGENLKNSYQVWTGAGFAVYGNAGDYSGPVVEEPLSMLIPPMQSILVERSDPRISSSTLTFNIENISTKGPAVLRSASQPKSKLEIIASNEAGAVISFVVLDEAGSETLGEKDTRKLMMSIGQMPEVYTIKPHEGKPVAVGGNYINSNAALLPLGLASTREGEMTLTFRGMDNYPAKISLQDRVTGEEKDISGQSEYQFTFDYVPPKEGTTVLPLEDRFTILFVPQFTTDWDEPWHAGVSIYADKRKIHAISSETNPIRSLSIYDVRGGLVYSEPDVDALQHTVETQTFLPEVYVVQVTTDTEVKTVKVVIND